VHIVDLDNGNTAVCRVDDRGPYEGDRIIDLSPEVFSQLAPTSTGIINVRISW
jgi:rare lipoprotein A